METERVKKVEQETHIERNIVRYVFVFPVHVGRILFSKVNSIIHFQCMPDNLLFSAVFDY